MDMERMSGRSRVCGLLLGTRECEGSVYIAFQLNTQPLQIHRIKWSVLFAITTQTKYHASFHVIDIGHVCVIARLEFCTTL